MPKIIKNGLEYSGVPTEVVTAWPPTGDSVLVDVPEMGNTDISSIGDGTITGSISALKNGLALQDLSSSITTSQGTFVVKQAHALLGIAFVNFEIALSSGLVPGTIIMSGIPKVKGRYLNFVLNDSGSLKAAYVDNTNVISNATVASGRNVSGWLSYVIGN